ncbi:Phenylalanine--tRNA ligase beta subunit [Candidatus Zixiibacteriota bacterium]|nr:Phenylalanine--tRNA ligase beta subunit [candidate division Zixibacteria bacterium]
MQLPYGWLKELVAFDWSPEELASRLTLCGTAAAASRFSDNGYGNIVVGSITELETIKGSDHLKKALVDIGEGKTVPVVCGAPNAARGQKVVLAQVGAVLSSGMEIKKVTLRGVESYGMICSERELGLTDDHSGIMVLPDDAPVANKAGEYLGVDDYVLKFDLTPNRPDSLSAIGVARDIACLAGNKIKRPSYDLKESSYKASDAVKISIADPGACPRYAARVIKGVKIGPSPWWIKAKLILCGIRPISNVVDITNLVMLELGHPLHAFDYRQFAKKEVLVRRAAEGEKFTTLDGKEHTLTPEVLLITDGDKGVAAAGVMGGLHSEVSESTTDILLESAYFDSITIRKSRMKLGMTSESSLRFEKGADPNIIPEAVNRAAYLIQKYAGGEIYQGIVDCYPRKIEPMVIDLRPSRTNKILGTEIARERMQSILEGLEFRVTVKGDDSLTVAVPTFRPDITREIDLIEEIARIEGYDKIPAADRNIGPLFTSILSDDRLRQEIRNIMTAQGYDEICGSGLADPMMLEKVSPGAGQVRIINPIAEDFSVLQNTIIYSLLRAVSNNFAQRNLDIRIFEIGRIFIPQEKGAPLEIEQLGLALSGRTDDQWYGKGREHDFYGIKGAIEALTEQLNIKVDYRPQTYPIMEDGGAFELKIGEKAVGMAGQIKPPLARAFDVKQGIYIAVLDFGELLKNRQRGIAYRPLPRYPAAPRDIAIVVDETVKAGDIIDLIKKTGGPLLERVELFDLYRGKQIGEGKKSLAFALSYRSNERSLESSEVSELHGKIASMLKEHFKSEVREG